MLSAALPLCFGCTQSVDHAARDVQQAQDRATANVQAEQRKLEDTKRDAADRVARQERRVEDAAREGNKDIAKQERDLQDAARAQQNRADSDITPITPDTTITTPAPATRAPADVNVNRTPGGGVHVDVNPKP
jgi:hypothetical protein